MDFPTAFLYLVLTGHPQLYLNNQFVRLKLCQYLVAFGAAMNRFIR